MSGIVFYALLWLSFGLLHSVLAARGVKNILANWTGQRYRLFYNVFATLHTTLVLLLGMWLTRDIAPFVLPAAIDIILMVCLVLGIVLGAVSLRAYDLGVFSGLSSRDMDSEKLRTDGLHSYVRHPLYSALFLVFIGLAGTPFGLLTALLGSAYLVLGTLSEEQKLIDLYGDDYRKYRREVPAFVPWRGRRMLPNR